MKRNIKFFTIVISLFLLSAIILTGCMYAIAADTGEMKSYDLNGQNSDSSGGNLVEDAPLAQTALQTKFNAYLHKDGKTVTIFSEEQYAELKSVRENDNRIPLTQEEILFLVNDSINLYFTYDEIVLPNANRDNVIPLLTNQSGNDRVINPEYSGNNAYDTYSEAETAYNKMLTDIYEIIYYRIYMHDAGFETVYHTYHSGKDHIFGNRYNGDLGMISSAVPVGIYQMLAIDDATFSGVENEEKLCGEYKTLFEWKNMWESDAIIDYEHYPYLNSAVLCTSILNTVRRPMEYKFYIVGPKDEPARQIYPTAELENMMPFECYYYKAKTEYGSFKPVFSIDYKTGKFAMSAADVMSFAIIGKFEESDGVLKLYPTNAGDEGVYSYVLHEQNGTWVYSAKDSKPIELAGFDWHKDIVFEKVHEGVSTPQNPDPPANDKTESDTDEEQWGYLKYDSNSDYCSLISTDGSDEVDGGSYIKEADKLVFMFKTRDGVYTYYFNDCGENVYTYSKGQSNPIPGYEFEDELEFILTVFDNCSSCLLEVKTN